MKHPHVREKLSDYIDGMLSREESSSVKEHLDRCPACMEDYADMVKIIGHMNRMETLETPDSFLAKVHERIDKQSVLHRLIKGLFLPIKIKVPLELAGLAAAALLVVYIIGVHGKRQVYELAYVQRSQSPAMLKAQALDKGLEIDEATTLTEGTQPKSELEEKKEVEKKDKRIGAEEAVSPREKDLSALAPQEKKIESRAETEQAMPRSNMLQEEKKRKAEPQREAIEDKAQIEAEAPSVAMPRRGEKPVELMDREKGEAGKDAYAKPMSREQYLKDIIAMLGGKIIGSEYNEETRVLKSLVIEIPADHYQKLIQTLEEEGDILKPYPAIKEKDHQTVTIRLLLQQ